MPLRVLIADDSKTVRTIIRAYLEGRDNVEVCGEVEDGREAVGQALASNPDLVILDFMMPELSGIEVSSILRTALPNCKIILFTLFADEVSEKLATAVGANVILPKPEGMTALLSVLDSLVATAGEHISEPSGVSPESAQDSKSLLTRPER
jgi:DNA-binding NarL/FixJ family response regulator